MTTIKDTMNLFWSSAIAESPIKTNPANPPSCEVLDEVFAHRIIGHPSTEAEILEAAAIPDHAIAQTKPNLTQRTWYRQSVQIFGERGYIAKAKPDYEVRKPQIQLADLIQRGIEMRVPVLGEAGTGTGKSFAYLFTAYCMGKRVIVSAPTNTLIMQLLYKDLPFMQKLFPEMTFSGLMGKGNYFCPQKMYRETDYSANAMLVPKVSNKQLIEWFESPGNQGTIQDYPYLVDDAVRECLADDESVCRGCVFRDLCPYKMAKEAADGVDVLVTNHSLLCMSHIYKQAELLPIPGVLVIDEAHELANYARNAAGIAITKRGIEKLLKRIEAIVSDVTRYSHLITYDIEKLEFAMEAWTTEIWTSYQGTKDEYQTLVDGQRKFDTGLDFAKELRLIADEIWEEGEKPAGKDEAKWMNFATTLRRKADDIRRFSLPTPNGFVRYIDIKEDTYNLTPFDVSDFLHDVIQPVEENENLFQAHQCHLCGDDLRGGDSVFVLGSNGYCAGCIGLVDYTHDAEIMSIADFLTIPEKPQVKPYSSVLVSATLATGKRTVQVGSIPVSIPDFESLKIECGISEALEIKVSSPFAYAEKLTIYAPTDFPDPSKDRNAHQEHCISEMQQLVLASRGGAFLLFTSNASLKIAYDSLKGIFESAGLLVLRQGDKSKQEIVKAFKESGVAVLFATRSFGTGVDIPGDALRLEVIDKLPFQAPNPITQAMSDAIVSKAIERGVDEGVAKWLPFDQLSIPDMVTTLKQWVGRLIRTQYDEGVVVILDPRLRKAKYGRRVLESLPDGFVTNNPKFVESFFRSMKSRIDVASATTRSELSDEELAF